jgi:two-component system chemotaxis response regulator CheY
MNAKRPEPAEILIIDEDPLALAAATTALETAGHVVYQARERAEALRIARTRALDLMICDLGAGDAGLALSRELRCLPGMQDVPVMFISRTQVPDIVRRSHEAGGAYYLRKPLDPEVLIDLVGKALWLPHLVESRLAMHEPASRRVPMPRTRSSARAAVVQGIRLPIA